MPYAFRSISLGTPQPQILSKPYRPYPRDAVLTISNHLDCEHTSTGRLRYYFGRGGVTTTMYEMPLKRVSRHHGERAVNLLHR